MTSGFAILHEDTACLVVCKPAGLRTQAPLGIDSLELRHPTTREYVSVVAPLPDHWPDASAFV